MIVVAGACDEGPVGVPAGAAVFELEVSGERFRAAVSDTAEIRRLEARMASGEEGVVSGALRAGPGGVNAPWGWHMDPASVHVADMAIELCDGRPSMVQEDLPYWIGTVKQFCPWGAKVVARTQ
jgi:hypothetical protein